MNFSNQWSCPKLLRTYERTAEIEHYCNNCRGVIQPGEKYEGRVYLNPFVRKKRIVVGKEHLHCPYDPDFEFKPDYEVPWPEDQAHETADEGLLRAA